MAEAQLVLDGENKLAPQPCVDLSLALAEGLVGALFKLKDQVRGTLRAVVPVEAKVLSDALELVHVVLHLRPVRGENREVELVAALTEIFE